MFKGFVVSLKKHSNSVAVSVKPYYDKFRCVMLSEEKYLELTNSALIFPSLICWYWLLSIDKLAETYVLCITLAKFKFFLILFDMHDVFMTVK